MNKQNFGKVRIPTPAAFALFLASATFLYSSEPLPPATASSSPSAASVPVEDSAKGVDSPAAAIALEILEVTRARDGLKAEFDSTVDDLAEKLKTSGFPSDGIAAVRATFAQWFEREIRWEEIGPRLAAAYVRVFSTEELEALLAFYRTPAGQKVAARLPDLLLETVTIRQEYAAGKQEILNKEIGLALNKYKAR